MKDQQGWKAAKQELAFVDKLTEEENQFLEDNVAEVSYRKGFNIYSMDCDCPGVLLIKSGWVRVYMLSRDGREITLYRMGPGEVCVISAACCLGGMTFEAHIDAETDMEAWLIPSSAYRRLKEQNIYVENFTYEKTVEKFRDVMWVMEQILFMSLEERIAIFLMDETERRESRELKDYPGADCPLYWKCQRGSFQSVKRISERWDHRTIPWNSSCTGHEKTSREDIVKPQPVCKSILVYIVK